MKKIKYALLLVAAALALSGCNTDANEGIFESMMNSTPNASYTIRGLYGIVDDKFLIETYEKDSASGIELLDKSGNRTCIYDAPAEVVLVDESDILIAARKSGETDASYLLLSKNGGDTYSAKEIDGVKYGNIGLSFEASYFDFDSVNNKNIYTLLFSSADNPQKKYVVKGENVTYDGVSNTYAVNSSPKEFDLPSAGGDDRLCIVGDGFFYIKDSEGYKLFELISGNQVYPTDGTAGKSEPVAVVGKYLFLADGSILDKDKGYAKVENVSHSLTNPVSSQHAPVATNSDYSKVVGFSNAKPFLFDGTTLTQYAQIGSDVRIVAVYLDGETVYAFTASSGVMKTSIGSLGNFDEL